LVIVGIGVKVDGETFGFNYYSWLSWSLLWL